MTLARRLALVCILCLWSAGVCQAQPIAVPEALLAHTARHDVNPKSYRISEKDGGVRAARRAIAAHARWQHDRSAGRQVAAGARAV